MKFKGKIKDVVQTFKGGYILTLETFEKLNEEDLQDLMFAKNGISIELKKWREQRSLNANAYFHLLVNEIAKKLNMSESDVKRNLNLEYGTIATDSNGNKVVIKLPASVNIFEYYNYAKFIGDKTENGLTLNYYVFYKETHTLNTEEMARLIDGVVAECKELGIKTETPEQLAKMKSLWSTEK